MAKADTSPGASLQELKKDYLSYLDLKQEEIREQKLARRYYHGDQYTKDQIRIFDRRKQPVVTYNRVGRKINAVVGLLERQRQDPRAYPRTPNQEEGAETATAVLRYILDAQEWKAKSPVVGINGAIDGLGGVEIIIEAGDKGDPDIGFETVDPGAFFYDARSLKMDFDDANYMGIGKWAGESELIRAFPDKEDEIRASGNDDGAELTSDPASDVKWVEGSEGRRRIRVIDHWYRRGSDWYYCIYTGSTILAEDISYLRDEKGRTACKFVMYSANVDQDGDRYGFVRGMKSAQDEINQRRSKALHTLSSRRVTVTKGAVDDVEELRREAVKPDGVIVKNPGSDFTVEFDDAQRQAEVQGQLEFLGDAKAEIENYGFNPALMGSSAGVASGRALQIQQQSGIAELGPYLLSYKGWKLRLYKLLWAAAQEHWTAERFIRVTDDPQLAKFFAVNQVALHPQTLQPVLINALGSVDVDIIIDEGPDEINMQADAYDTLSVMASKGAQVPPEVLIELSPLPGSTKRKVMQIIQQDQQQKMQMAAPQMQIEMQSKQAQTAKTMAEAKLSLARAGSEGQGSGGADPSQRAFDKWKAMLDSYTSIKVAEIGKGATLTTAAMDAEIDKFLGLSGLASDQMMQLRDHAHQRVMQAMQPQPAMQAAE